MVCIAFLRNDQFSSVQFSFLSGNQTFMTASMERRFITEDIFIYPQPDEVNIDNYEAINAEIHRKSYGNRR